MRLWLFVLLAALGCARKDEGRAAVPAGVTAKTDRIVLRHGPLGMDGASRGTYVLVDVENRTAELRSVVAAGTLKNTAGEVVGELGYDEVIIPPGATRTFALTAAVEHRDAVAADVIVRDAREVKAPPFLVGDVRLSDATGGGKVLTATVVNRHKRAAVANVYASFHDADGRILERPWQRVLINPKDTKEVRFAAPAGAVRGEVYHGDVLY